MTRKRSANWYKRRGAELIEFTFVFIPFLGFTLLLIDLGWIIYQRTTLQGAVREGCRFAITNQTMPGVDSGGLKLGVVASINSVVQTYAHGMLGTKTTDPGYAMIKVRYYDPNASLTSALPVPVNCADKTVAPNQGGNIVEVSVENFPAVPLAPIVGQNFIIHAPLYFVARSSDRMEGNPIGGVPLVFDGTCP